MGAEQLFYRGRFETFLCIAHAPPPSQRAGAWRPLTDSERVRLAVEPECATCIAHRAAGTPMSPPRWVAKPSGCDHMRIEVLRVGGVIRRRCTGCGVPVAVERRPITGDALATYVAAWGEQPPEDA